MISTKKPIILKNKAKEHNKMPEVYPVISKNFHVESTYDLDLIIIDKGDEIVLDTANKIRQVHQATGELLEAMGV
tara:strand:+ start:2166 stop:2390 length:225 start_codon:yes stop_codon:yes gene_type:complete